MSIYIRCALCVFWSKMMRFPILTSVADYNLARGDTSDGRTDGRTDGRAGCRTSGRARAGTTRSRLGRGDSMSDLSQLSIENRSRRKAREGGAQGRCDVGWTDWDESPIYGVARNREISPCCCNFVGLQMRRTHIGSRPIQSYLLTWTDGRLY